MHSADLLSLYSYGTSARCCSHMLMSNPEGVLLYCVLHTLSKWHKAVKDSSDIAWENWGYRPQPQIKYNAIQQFM